MRPNGRGKRGSKSPAPNLPDLKPHERQLLDHIAARAKLGGGAVLEAALRLESSEHAKRWMADFSGKVITEARERGLVEERVSLRTCFWLWVALLVAVVLLAIAAIGVSFLFHGTDPVAALYTIPGALAFFGAWAALLYGFTAHPERWSIPPIVLAAGWVIFALGNFLVWRFVYRGLYDLRAGTVGIEGQVIYLDVRDNGDEHPGKIYHVAIDDGRKSTAIKHEIDQDLFDQLRYGDWLRLDVTPKLRCVRSRRIVTAPV